LKFMFILLPIFSFFILSWALGRSYFNSRREAYLVSAVACSLWVWLVTEGFSLFRMLNVTAIVLSWAIFLAGAIILFLKEIRISPEKTPSRLTFAPLDIVIIISILLILLGTLLLALVSPPNTWDALTYHMSRVVHWAQNGTLAPYPTHISRQIFFNPGFEYFVLNFYLLAGCDAWVNGVQWFAMVFSLMVVTLIAKQLGASMRGQLLAAGVAVTIPMGIVEASSLQGDYMTAFFLSASVYALLRWRVDVSWAWAVLLGVTSGLGILTKGTGILFILPVLIWLVGLAFISRLRIRWQQVLVVISLVVIINTGFVLRSVLAFPSRTLMEATQEGRSVLNENFGPDIFLINVLRDTGMYVGTSSERLNKKITQGIRFLPAVIGINIDDPRATLSGTHFQINKPTRDENATSAGVHFILTVIFLLLVWFLPKTSSGLRAYGLCLISMAVVFCVAVKWQPWLTRLQLPFFVLASAGIGVLLEKVRFSFLQLVIITSLFFFAIPYTINSYPRHLFGKKNVFMQTREEQYFSMSKGRYKNYAQISDLLAASGCHDIGLVIGGDDWEYPLWPLLKDRGMTNMRLEHIEIKGPLAQIPYPLGDFHPCARITVAGPVAEVTIFVKTNNKNPS